MTSSSAEKSHRSWLVENPSNRNGDHTGKMVITHFTRACYDKSIQKHIPPSTPWLDGYSVPLLIDGWSRLWNAPLVSLLIGWRDMRVCGGDSGGSGVWGTTWFCLLIIALTWNFEGNNNSLVYVVVQFKEDFNIPIVME